MSIGASHYFRWRERVRGNPTISKLIFLTQSLRYSNFGAFRRRVIDTSRHAVEVPASVALCCRIRDEARYLREFVEYYLAAGIAHFFFYEKLSADNFRESLRTYIDRGLVTLCEDWPHIPISPSAPQDCVLRCIGRFRWVGFIDADEFVVIRDGRSISDFLSDYGGRPGVALHWYMFGSNGHKLRPPGPVITEYTRRQVVPNRHVKCFIRPELVARYRNSHSWYFRGMRSAVTELDKEVTSSFSVPPTAERAWINHYHHKSDQDYFEKAARKSVLDKVGIRFENRNLARHVAGEKDSNAVVDESAVIYYLQRCRALQVDPILLTAPSLSSKCTP